MSTTPVLHQSSMPEVLTEDQWIGLERTAKRLARVSWIPAAYKPCPPQGNKPGKTIEQAEAEIAAAGLALFSIGRDLTPMTLKLVYVVNGTVDFMFELISAQVHAHGHELWVVDESPISATVAGQRRGSSRVHTVTYTWDDAVRAGLTVRKDYKTGQMVPTETYQKNPRDMLVARAGKRCAKRVAPEALLTMPPAMNYVHTDSGRIQLAEIIHDDPQDDDITDAELVEHNAGPKIATPPGASAVDGAEQTAASAGDRETVPNRSAHEGGAGEQFVGTPVPAPGPVDWPALAKAHDVSPGKLLLVAREKAGARGLPLPGALEDITDEQLEADVRDWLGE